MLLAGYQTSSGAPKGTSSKKREWTTDNGQNNAADRNWMAVIVRALSTISNRARIGHPSVICRCPRRDESASGRKRNIFILRIEQLATTTVTTYN